MQYNLNEAEREKEKHRVKCKLKFHFRRLRIQTIQINTISNDMRSIKHAIECNRVYCNASTHTQSADTLPHLISDYSWFAGRAERKRQRQRESESGRESGLNVFQFQLRVSNSQKGHVT